MSSNYNTKKGNRKFSYKSSVSPIGIDIGAAQVKMVQLQQKAGNLFLLSHAVMPTPTGTFFAGRVSDPEKLAFKIGQLKKNQNLKGNLVNLGLGPDAHYLRLVELPPLSKRDLQKTLPWEIEKHFPLKAGEAVYDCCPLAESKVPGNGSSKYILAAAESRSAAALSATAKKAGFKLLSLEVTPLSLLRSEALVQSNKPERTGTYRVLLDIGYSSASLLLTGKGMLQYCRHLRIGVVDFIKEVAHARGISLTEALRYIFSYKSQEAGNAMKSAELLAELTAGSIGYHLDQAGSGGTEPNLLVVSGGGAAIPGLLNFLQKKISIKVEPQQLPVFSDSRRNTAVRMPPVNTSIYATAFGLALRGWIR